MKFEPHDYQAYAIQYIETHPIAAVLLDMGLGKTIISLTAIFDLLFDSFEIHRVLVVAPLRVARDTWPSEIEKWSHLSGLTYAVAVGTVKERKAAMLQSADITIINRENLQWLIDDSGFPFDFDMVIIDELSSFKNHKAKRFKSLMKVRPLYPQDHRSYRHAFFQRTYGSMGRIQAAGYGAAPRTLYHTVPDELFHPGQAKRRNHIFL
jgi:superfamily II DNA or RNA helicase